MRAAISHHAGTHLCNLTLHHFLAALPPERHAHAGEETMTLIRQMCDPKGRPNTPVVGTHTFSVQPATAGDETRYEFIDRLTLPPRRGGTVLTAIDIPDVSRAPVTLSGGILGTVPRADAPRTDALAAVVPLVPTSARNFAASDTIVAFFHVLQGGTAAASPVTLRVQIINGLDQAVFDRTETLSVEAFTGGRGVARQIALPLAELTTRTFAIAGKTCATGAKTCGTGARTGATAGTDAVISRTRLARASLTDRPGRFRQPGPGGPPASPP